MTVVYIEPLPKTGGGAITGYAIEERDGHALHNTSTQAEAIAWAKDQGHTPHVARVRYTDKGNPDHWRAA